MITNNVTRLLDARGIAFQALELPNEKLSAMEAAGLLGVDPNKVFKTIVIRREAGKKPILALVQGPCEVDLKGLAKSVGEKKVFLATQKEAEKLTGLQSGGISPLALINRRFHTVLDNSARSFDQIYISGGQRGLNIRLAWQDLLDLTGGELAPISK